MFSCPSLKLSYFPLMKLDLTIDDAELYLPGFELIRKDRVRNGRNGGRACFYVRCNLNY